MRVNIVPRLTNDLLREENYLQACTMAVALKISQGPQMEPKVKFLAAQSTCMK